MSWVKVDDAAMSHPKLLEVGPLGTCLWLAALCYCNRHTTDGLVPRAALLALYPSEELPPKLARETAERLVRAGLWETCESGWRIHDYAEYQGEAMRSVRDQRREAERARKARQRVPSSSRRDTPGAAEPCPAHVPAGHGRDTGGTPGGVPPGHPSEDGQDTAGTPGGVPPGVPPLTRARAGAIPARPGPTRPISEGEGSVVTVASVADAPPRETQPSLRLVEPIEAQAERSEAVRRALLGGYARRYEAATGDLWQGHGRAAVHVDEVLRWALVQADPMAAVERLLDGVFATPRFQARRWPWAWVAEDPAAIAATSTRMSGAERIAPLTFEEAT